MAASLLIQNAMEWNTELWICKLDIRKAFDTLDWGFIKRTLDAAHVGPSYIQALMQSYGKPTGAIKVEERKSKPFNKSRGTRQGDPLSAMLFVSTLKYILKPLVDKWALQGKGFATDMGGAHEFLTNLGYADDLLLIARKKRFNGNG